MISVVFSTLAGSVSDYQLDIRGVEYFVRLYAASFCSSVLCFVAKRRTIKVPGDFSLQISTSEGSKQVYPFEATYFPLNHSMVYTLIFKNKVVVCIVPPPSSSTTKLCGAPIIRKRDRADLLSSCSSLASSEDVTHYKKTKYEASTTDSSSSSEEEEEEEEVTGERREMRLYIRKEYEYCEKLRNKIDSEGTEYFYYNYTTVPVGWETYHSFVVDGDCWCGKCVCFNK